MALRSQRSVDPQVFRAGADEAGEEPPCLVAFRDLVHVQGGEEEVVVDPEPRRLQGPAVQRSKAVDAKQARVPGVVERAAGAACHPDLAQGVDRQSRRIVLEEGAPRPLADVPSTGGVMGEEHALVQGSDDVGLGQFQPPVLGEGQISARPFPRGGPVQEPVEVPGQGVQADQAVQQGATA